jgi:hypothetical protein
VPNEQKRATQSEPATRSYDRDQLQYLLARKRPQPTAAAVATVAIELKPNLGMRRDPERTKSKKKTPRELKRRDTIHTARVLALGIALLSCLGFLAWQHVDPHRAAAANGQARPHAALAKGRGFERTASSPKDPPELTIPSRTQPDQPTRNLETMTAMTTSVAAALLASGHELEALCAYRALSRAQPHNPVFSAIAVILERKLSTHSEQPLEPGASPCTPPAP